MNTPKFKKGDWIKRKKDGRIAQVVMLLKTCYDLRLTDGDGWWLDYDYQDNWELTDAPPKNKLEEAAYKYADTICPVEYPELFDDEQLRNAFIAGAKWQKEQMLKEAVEGYVDKDHIVTEGPFYFIRSGNLDLPNGFKEGDIVRIIFCKKED